MLRIICSFVTNIYMCSKQVVVQQQMFIEKINLTIRVSSGLAD